MNTVTNSCRSHWLCGLRLGVCGRSFVGIAGSNTPGVMGVRFLWALCGVSECDRKVSIIRRLWPIGGLLCYGKQRHEFSA